MDKGRRIGLLIGNSDYNDPHLNKLVAPSHNIHEFEKILTQAELGNFEITTLANKSKSDIEEAIFDLFTNKAADDLLLLYITCHGLKDAEGALYFASADTKHNRIEVTATPASFIQTWIDKTFSEKVVVILDCCFSGAFGGTMAGLGEKVDIEREFKGRSDYGRIILTATDSMQYAWDRNTYQVVGEEFHSVFTKYLIEGIETGKADVDGDGTITTDDLFTYVYQHTIRKIPGQTPRKIVYNPGDSLVIAKNPNPHRLPAELEERISHPNPHLRISAVEELDELLYLHDQQNPKLIDEILTTLKKLSTDSVKRIAQRARSAIETFEGRNPAPTGEGQTLRVFLSSPGDVEKERHLVYKLARQLNADPKFGAQLDVIAWDDPNRFIPMYANESPQKVVNEALPRPSQCDIVIVILWSRIGTPLSRDFLRDDGSQYESGTLWEYEDAVKGSEQNNNRPAVFLFVNKSLPVLDNSDPKTVDDVLISYRKVWEVVNRLQNADGSLRGLFNTYQDTDSFEAIVEQSLRSAVRRLLTSTPKPKPIEVVTPVEAPPETINLLTNREYLDAYLNWMVEQHSTLELRGIGGDVRLPTIPLEKVYVALRGTRSSAYERDQSRQLLNAETVELISQTDAEVSPEQLMQLLYLAERRAIIQNPLMPSMADRDRPTEATADEDKLTVVTLGDAFRKERWMVVLGDPGSGKTTLARWITVKLASALVENEPAVIVPGYQVDPKAKKSDTSTINMGPARLPVLLRVSEFSEAYQRAKHDLTSLSLVDFLGYHSWLGQYPNIPQKVLNDLIRHYLREGRAVVILDGMDEITAASQRDDIVRAIETFVNDWINARGRYASGQEKAFQWNASVQGEPVATGGNQIIITSRIAGYHSAPITGQMAHVTVQPMQQNAVEHFCDAWMRAVHQVLRDEDSEAEILQKARIEASGLKKAIFDPTRPRVRELATNPLLVTILALVYRKNQGKLPEQRAELYHIAMEILIKDWRVTGMTYVELVYVLSPLAAHIHHQYSTGLIEESEMKEIVTAELADYRRLNKHSLPPSFELEVEEFIRRVRTDVGLLSERSEQLYGFLHLTFQEYLAALYLVRDKKKAVQEIIGRLDDPRWREPILMALGHVSVNTSWGPKARNELLSSLLNADDPLGDLIPRSALLITAAIPEMAQTSVQVIEEIIQRLLVTYADRDGVGEFETLQERIRQSLLKLHDSTYRGILETYLINTLREGKNQAMASADIINRNGWFSEKLTKALIQAYPYDSADWGFPITKALQQLTISPPVDPPKKPVLSAEQQEKLAELEETKASLENGSAAAQLIKEIDGLTQQFDQLWGGYVKHINESELQPRLEKLAAIQKGEREHYLIERIQQVEQEDEDELLEDLEEELEQLRSGQMMQTLEQEIATYRNLIQ